MNATEELIEISIQEAEQFKSDGYVDLVKSEASAAMKCSVQSVYNRQRKYKLPQYIDYEGTTRLLIPPERAWLISNEIYRQKFQLKSKPEQLTSSSGHYEEQSQKISENTGFLDLIELEQRIEKRYESQLQDKDKLIQQLEERLKEKDNDLSNHKRQIQRYRDDEKRLDQLLNEMEQIKTQLEPDQSKPWWKLW